MKSINYIIILILITIINLINTFVSTQEYLVIIDTTTINSYNDYECGDIITPCKSIGDAGEHARTLNKSKINEITFQFQNKLYQIENENSTFGNLYGYTLITFTNGIGSEFGPIVFDGTEFTDETTPFLSIILDDEIIEYGLEIESSFLIEISNITFRNFNENTSIFKFISNTTIGSQLNLIQFYNSTFENIESNIINSRKFISNNDVDTSSSSYDLILYSQQSTTILFSSCSFLNVNQITSIPFILVDSKLQLLESTISNSFITNLPFIEITSGTLRLFDCTFNSISSNNINNNNKNATFISLNNSGIDTQIELITITNSSINRFFKSEQTTPTLQYQTNYQYIIFNNLNILNNNFKISSDNSGSGVGGSNSIEEEINSNIGFIQLISNGKDLNFTQVLQVFKIQGNSITSSTGSGSSSSGSGGDILTLLSIEGGGVYLFDQFQFSDRDGFNGLNLINTNVTIKNSNFLSYQPLIGLESYVYTDSLTYFIGNDSNFVNCVNCPINGIIYSNDSGDNVGFINKNKTTISIVISIVGVIGLSIAGYKLFYKRKLDLFKARYKAKQDEEKYIDIADDHPSAESHLPLLYHGDDPRADYVNDTSEFQVAGDVDNLYYQTFNDNNNNNNNNNNINDDNKN